MLERRAAALERGERVIGWKLAFGAPASMQRFGLTGPVVGYLTDATLHPPGSTVSCEGWAGAVAEPELAARFGADVIDPDRAADAISTVGLAIELANVDPPPSEIEVVMAGNIYHQAVLLAEADEGHAGGDVGGLRVTVQRNDEEIADIDDVETLTGPIREIVPHAAGLLGAAGEAFRTGDVVILGSVTPPIPISPGDTITFTSGSLAPVSVRV
ncbi:MAG TPA: fumarylacetoacetate hydrolase family protein [Acidimicrobiia bacterium]|nr:fumarylacetoacetate hydrolase family protein [Acidimicrobiia bacterium]